MKRKNGNPVNFWPKVIDYVAAFDYPFNDIIQFKILQFLCKRKGLLSNKYTISLGCPIKPSQEFKIQTG